MRRICFCLILAGSFGLLPIQAAADKRGIIAACWNAGAVNEWLMQQCSGLNVPTEDFKSCMFGGFCLGEPAIPPPAPPGFPFCGAMGLPFCPAPSPCGFFNTIACPTPPGFPPPPVLVAMGCGSPPFPACVAPQACGKPTTLTCVGDGFIPLPAPQADMFGWQPNLQIVLPAPVGKDGFGIKNVLALPPIPDTGALSQCRNESEGEAEMYQCIVHRALPPAYRTTTQCMDENPEDNGAALVCSTGNHDLQDAYERMKEVQDCAKDHEANDDIAMCAGEKHLGPNERYYAKCVKDNMTNYGAAAACGLAKNLTPEQQIALSCAVKTGGNPKAFVVCTGGQLLAREIGKCWKYGVATEKGCFGPNNDLRKFADSIDGQMKTTLGENSEVYKAYKLYKDNVLLPGPTHDGVKAFNTALHDIQYGPSASNDIVKAGKQFMNIIPTISISFPGF